MKKYFDPEVEIVLFDVSDNTNFGDNDEPIEDYSENGTKWFFNW